MKTSKSYDMIFNKCKCVIIKKDYYIGESASNSRKSSYDDDDDDDLSLNIIIPQSFVNNSMQDSTASNKYTVTVAELAELAELYKEARSPNFSGSKATFEVSSEGGYTFREPPLPNSSGDCRSPSELVVKRLTSIVAPLPNVHFREHNDSTSFTTSQQSSPSNRSPNSSGDLRSSSELVVRRLTSLVAPLPDMFDPNDYIYENLNSNSLIECIPRDSMEDLIILTNQTHPGALHLSNHSNSSELVVKRLQGPEASCHIEVSSYANVHWYKKLNFMFIEPMIDRYRKRKIIPVN